MFFKPNSSVISISKPVISQKEYYMIEDYKSNYDKTFVAKNEKIVLLNKNLNGWALVRYKDETIYVPYALMATNDTINTLHDRIVLTNRMFEVC
jgi:hypothetical protein